ncbi:TonB-dependent receptor [Rhizobium sp. TH2]|uniref:TonB-dependent receptor domain-containing protein n=1 Tax=Rhizobium sp. TH2 TaxID=2775403 RepID=UPI0021581ECD|nr:TonB-dependent receptor [Rhizobium sp. TH2]UVC11468.1 TonB-dependent receptor [Rhizobium sp. TH2]
MRIHWAFAAALMSSTTFAMVLSVPAHAQEDVIVLDDDGAAPETETQDTAASADDSTPVEPGVTKLKRIVIGSDSAVAADIVNKPAPVSIIDGETIRERMNGKVDTAIRMTPGAFTRQLDEQPGIIVNIRGMQGNGRVNQMIDGVPQTFRNLSGHSGTSDNMVYIDKNLLAGVDITRGAAPGIDGMGTLSGAANFKTLGVDDILLPGKDVGGLVTLQAGTNGMNFSRLTAGGWRTNIGIDGKVSVIGAISGSDESNYRNGDGQWYINDASNHPRGGLFKVNYEPDGEQSLELGGVFYQNAFAVESGGYDWQINNQTYTAKYAYQPGDNLIDLKINAYLNITDVKMAGIAEDAEFDGRDGTDTGLGLDVSNTSVLDLNDSMSLKFFYGAGINSDKYVGNDAQGANPNGLLIKSGAFNDTTFTWGILGITGGMRYDYWSLAGKSCDVPPGEDDCPAIPVTRDGGTWNPKIGVTVDPTPWMQLYATYAHTMRPPSVSEVFFPGGHNFGGTAEPVLNNINLVPEKQKGLDIGVNLRGDGLFMSEDMGYLKIGYFKNRIDNYITFVTDDSSSPTVTKWMNLPGTTTMEGVEIEGGYDTGFAYTNLSLTIADTRQPLPEFAGIGNDVGRLPDDYATLDAGLRFFEQRLTLGGRIRYTGDSVQAYLDAKNSVDRPSYTLVDLYGSFKVTENAKLFFSVDNLLDKSYFSAVAGTSSVQDIANGRGRTIMIGATTRF